MPGCCGGSSRKNAAAFGVLSLLLVGIAYWGWEVTHPPPRPEEAVVVLVAARDLNTGTAFTKDNIAELTTLKEFPKSAIDPEMRIITDPKEMIGKRLKRATHEGEFFRVSDLSSSPLIECQFLDFLSLPFTPPVGDGFVGPNSRVDIVASYGEGIHREVFTLLPDMTVLAVNVASDLTRGQPQDPIWVSFSADGKQMKLAALAQEAGCTLELVVRAQDAPKSDWDFDATLARVEALLKRPPVAPTPRVVGNP